MANPYIYSISADMPGGAVNGARLHKEIVASAIATTLVGIGVVSDVLTVVFTGDLSAGDKTILDNDATGPSGGLLAAHDNSATPEVITLIVEFDPEINAVDAPKGSKIIWGHNWYCKEDDGLSTNVAWQGHVDLRTGEAGGSGISLVAYPSDPTMVKGDVVLVEQSGVIEQLFYDGTNKHLIGQSKGADIGHFYLSGVGASAAMAPGTPKNIFKGCTLTDGGLNGANWVAQGTGETVEIKYKGIRTKIFKVTAPINFTSNEAARLYSLQLSKTGSIDAKSKTQAKLVTGADGVTIFIDFVISMATNDTLRFMIDSDAGTPIATPRTAPILAVPL